MGFKMGGFSPFTKETPYEGSKHDKGGVAKTQTLKKNKTRGKITLHKSTKTTGTKPDVEKLKEKLFNMDNPNSPEGQKLQDRLRSLGVDLTSGNYDEID
tara:strand:+ start:648 stop:944 length:297 start_codon:yes stop_codon:yes gene_type:complete